MKLNFWQWLGVVLLAVGLLWIMLRGKNTPQPQPAPNPPAASQPAKAPATATAPAAK